MADPVVKFEPYMSAREPGGSLILDRNLLAIKKALADANATFVTIKNDISEIVTTIDASSSTTTNNIAPQLGMDSGDSGDDSIPLGRGSQSMAKLWMSGPDPTVPFGVNMGALGAGILQQTVSGGVATPSAFLGTQGSVLFLGASGVLAQDNANFFWDALNVRLGIGTNVPAAATEIRGNLLNNTLRVISTSAVSGGLYFQANQSGSQAVVYVDNDRGGFASYGGLLNGCSANAIGNLFGFSRADRVFLFSDGASNQGLIVGTLQVQPLSLGTGNTERLQITGAGTVQWHNIALMSFDGGGAVGTSAPTTFRYAVAPPSTASAASLGPIHSWDVITLTLTGGTTVNAVSFGKFSAPTITDASALTVTKASTLSISGPPAAAGSVTITTALAFDVEAGSMRLGALTAGGILKATAASGIVAIASASDVAAAITWPAANRVLVSSGTSTAPIGNSAFQWDDTNRILYMGAASTQRWANVGTLGSANTEYVEAAWSGNVFSLTSAITGAGTTVRAMKLTSSAGVTVDYFLDVNGASPATNTSFIVGHTTTADRDHVQFFVGGGAAQDNGAGGNTLFDLTPASTTIPAGTTTGVWSTARIRNLTYTGASSPTITEAASLYIDGAPTVSSATVGNRYALHVAAGPSLIGGDVQLGNPTGVVFQVFAGSGVNMNATIVANVTSATSAVFDGFSISASPTITGATNITTVTGFNAVTIFQPQYGGTVTITHAATLRIADAPSPGGNTITNPYSLWIDAGRVRWDGQVALGGGAAATLGTIGGSGPGTAAQSKWLPVNSDGTTYYIPLWQ